MCSNVGAGAVLLQADDEGIHSPVSYFSKRFSSYQLNCSVVEVYVGFTFLAVPKPAIDSLVPLSAIICP